MPVTIRTAEPADIPAMAAIRAREWETEPYWLNRITRYLAGELSPQQALAPRTAFVAVDDGEIEGIDTIEQRPRQGIAGSLLRPLGEWFERENALKVCVDPGNAIARVFYVRYGAQPLSQHWMFWPDIREITA